MAYAFPKLSKISPIKRDLFTETLCSGCWLTVSWLWDHVCLLSPCWSENQVKTHCSYCVDARVQKMGVLWCLDLKSCICYIFNILIILFHDYHISMKILPWGSNYSKSRMLENFNIIIIRWNTENINIVIIYHFIIDFFYSLQKPNSPEVHYQWFA